MNRRQADRDSADLFSGKRQAVIDIGSNTVRLVIYGGSQRAPVTLWNEKVTARLGSELSETGLLPEDSIDLAIEALARYRTLLDNLGIEDIEAVATAAIREADNRDAFLDKCHALDIHPRVITGEEEALVSGHGVIGAFPGAKGVMADIGGGSLELIGLGADGFTKPTSLKLGTLRLPKIAEEGSDAFDSAISKGLTEAGWDKSMGGTLYLVGGTWRALAHFAMSQADLPIDDPHGLALATKDALALAEKVANKKPEKLASIPLVSSSRSPYLPLAASLLTKLIETLQPEALVFSSWGLREGLLFQRLDSVARLQDPLLAGVTAFASPRGGAPALASHVAGWTLEAQIGSLYGSERVRLAATMLALASIQVEPNLRIPQALNWALHKRWLNVTALERAMIASAVAASCGASEAPAELAQLAPAEAIDEAFCWGLAIRLCRRLGINAPITLRNTRLTNEDGTLVLSLAENQSGLLNKGVERDLERLADCLSLRQSIEIVEEI